MLVIIRAETNEILIYGDKGCVTLPISEKAQIMNAIGSKMVYYVTSAKEADVADIMALTDNMQGIATSPVPQNAMPSQPYMSDKKFLKSNVKGIMTVPNEDAKTPEDAKKALMIFESEYDCYPYNEEVVKKSSVLKAMISSGKVSIINEQQYKVFIAQHQSVMSAKAAKQKAAEDAMLSNILVNEPVGQFITGGAGYDSFPSMDVGGNGKVMTDAEQISKMLGM